MKRRSKGQRSKGQAMAEFALVAPVFFLLLFGIIEGGRFIFYYEVLHNATREGARYAIVNGSRTIGRATGPAAPGTTSSDPTGLDVVQAVRNSAFGVLGTGVTVQRCWWYDVCDFTTHGDGNNARGAMVTVAASYTYSSLVPLIPLPSITVSAESSLVVNN